jgi:spore coat protein U-like protein
VGLRALACLVVLTAAPATAGATQVPTTATFAVTAQVVSGCVVVSGSSSGLNFGTLAFGSYPAVSTGQVSASATGGSAQIQCTPGVTLTMTIDGGLNPSASATQRNVKATGATLVGYRLYADSGHTQAIGINQGVSVVVPASGSVTLPIYGVLTLPGATAAPGTYSDTAQVTISY